MMAIRKESVPSKLPRIRFFELRIMDEKIVFDTFSRSDRLMMEAVGNGVPGICGMCGRIFSVSQSCCLAGLAVMIQENGRYGDLIRGVIRSRTGGAASSSPAIYCTCGNRATIAQLMQMVGRFIASGDRQIMGEGFR